MKKLKGFNMSNIVPSYLSQYSELWQQDPHNANLEWFRNARFGMFIHYGLYSLLGKGEWVQFNDKIPVSEYEKLSGSFKPENFDADFITDLACEAEMKYVNLVTCHHDSFCLWNSRNESFNSVNSPCKRDFVGEMAEQCTRKGLGFFTYYTYMLNWRHPSFLSREYFDMARPDYSYKEPRYTFNHPDDFLEYIDYVHAALTELLTEYGSLAGIWLDLIMGYYAQPDFMPVSKTYELVHTLQPHALVAFKQGATGEEDFATPEHSFHSLADKAREMFGERSAMIADAAWEKNKNKHNEICATMQDKYWAYYSDARHISDEEIKIKLSHAATHNCNLLLNIGPLPDGSVHPEDIKSLRAVGKSIREDGWPMPESELKNDSQLYGQTPE
jgi:alpha-L-fucosidase